MTLILLLILVTAGTMRFYKLGDWSFAGDELATISEANSLWGSNTPSDRSSSVHSQITRLPKITPLAHTTHYFGYRLFGEDEWGARVVPALFGTLSIGIIFWLAVPLLGTSGALTLTLIVTFLPEHLFQSQNNRFYSVTFFFDVFVFLLAATVTKYRSASSSFFLGVTALGMILCHALTGLIWGIVLAGIIAAAVAQRRFPSCNVCIILIAFSLLFLCFAVFYIVPLAKGWNETESWGYSPLHALLAAVNKCGFPIALLAGLGGLLAVTNIREPDNAFWMTVAVLSFACVLILPKIMVFNPQYLFLFIFPFLVLAARFADCVFLQLRKLGTAHCSFLAAVWLVMVCCLNMPSSVSYYLDGSRHNNREAYEYVQKHWQEGDRITGYSMGNARYYIPQCEPRIPLSPTKTIEQLQELITEEKNDGRRLWLVVGSHRGGLNLDLRRWLGKNCSYEQRISKKRYDYNEYTVEVFLFEPLSKD